MKFVILLFILGIPLGNFVFITTWENLRTSQEERENGRSSRKFINDSSVSGENVLKIDDKTLQTSNPCPTVLMAIFVKYPTPFLEEQLNKLRALDYPKESIHVFIYNNVTFHAALVDTFVKKASKKYASVELRKPADGIPEHEVVRMSLEYCQILKCDYYFAVESVSHLDNHQTLKILIREKRRVVAPLLLGHDKVMDILPGVLNAISYKKEYYENILHGNRNCYLIDSRMFEIEKDKYNLRDVIDGIYISNETYFGHTVEASNYKIDIPSPELYQIFANPYDWETRYISREYGSLFSPSHCPIVMLGPITTRAFCKELLEIAEPSENWEYVRVTENDGTIFSATDLPLLFIKFEKVWTEVVKKYIFPLVYIDFSVSTSYRIVRFTSSNNPNMKLHFDPTNFTINLALNERGVDYEGGGCRYVCKYNCTFPDMKLGWILIHKLAIPHDVMTVTNGTRYVLISFL